MNISASSGREEEEEEDSTCSDERWSLEASRFPGRRSCFWRRRKSTFTTWNWFSVLLLLSDQVFAAGETSDSLQHNIFCLSTFLLHSCGLLCSSQSQGCFLSRTGPWKSGPPEARLRLHGKTDYFLFNLRDFFRYPQPFYILMHIIRWRTWFKQCSSCLQDFWSIFSPSMDKHWSHIVPHFPYSLLLLPSCYKSTNNL